MPVKVDATPPAETAPLTLHVTSVFVKAVGVQLFLFIDAVGVTPFTKEAIGILNDYVVIVGEVGCCCEREGCGCHRLPGHAIIIINCKSEELYCASINGSSVYENQRCNKHSVHGDAMRNAVERSTH